MIALSQVAVSLLIIIINFVLRISLISNTGQQGGQVRDELKVSSLELSSFLRFADRACDIILSESSIVRYSVCIYSSL